LPKLTKRRPKHSMAEAIGGLIAGVIFGVWWLVGLKHQFWIFGPGIAVMHFGPIWQTIYPLFVVLVIADALRHTIDIARPGWEKGRVAFRMFFRAMNLLVLYFLINAGELIVASDTAAANLQPVIKGINSGLHIGVVVAAVVSVAQLMWDLYNLMGNRGGDGASAAACL